jgi:hypothetical protein
MSFYKNGIEVDKIVYNDCEKINYFIEEDLSKEKCYDLLILSDKKENSNCINKIHYTEFPKTTEYINSNIKFFSMELSYNNNSYSIELKNNDHDHYIVNNILNKNFFKYYVINKLNVEIKEDNFDYTVSIIDHNVNIIEMNSTSQLLIKEMDYELICNVADTVEKNSDISSVSSDSSYNSDNSDNSDSSNNSDNSDSSDSSNNSDKYVKINPQD